MASFVYAPTVYLISIVMFSATLYERRKIGTLALSALALAAPLLLVLTVMSQETFFADTSTQQLILGLAETDPIVWMQAL